MARKFTDLILKPIAALADVIAFVDPEDNTSKRTTVGGLINAIVSNLPLASVKKSAIDFTDQRNAMTYVRANKSTAPQSASGNILFNSKTNDVLNEYNAATGVFTAQESGLYSIEWNLRGQTALGAETWIRVNNVNINNMESSGYPDAYVMKHSSKTIPLNAGDTMSIYFRRDSGTLDAYGNLTITRIR